MSYTLLWCPWISNKLNIIHMCMTLYSSKIPILCESFVTMLHLCGFSSVCLQMACNIPIPWTNFAKVSALIRPLSSVCPLRVHKIVQHQEILTTPTALLWLLPSVCYHMVYQFTAMCTSLSTIVTLIWFLPCVRYQMFY